MAKKPVENNPASVSNNIAEPVVSLTAQEATQRVFETVVRMDKVGDIADDIAALITTELKNASFMTVNLELSDEQREKMLDFVTRACHTARDRYVANLKKDERTKANVMIVELAMRNVVEEALSAIGQEVNRGAIISSTAVSASAKKDDFNSIELQYSKNAGDITIPTRGVFISTNCVQLIQASCQVDLKAHENAKKQA